MTYDIEYTFDKSSFANRQLDKTILKFTAGVASIEEAYVRYQLSPYIVNPLLDIKIFKDGSNYWCLKISGMDDNVYSTSYRWYVRMRFFPNANTLSYTSTTYAANGEVEFTNSDSESLSQTTTILQLLPPQPSNYLNRDILTTTTNCKEIGCMPNPPNQPES